MNVYDFDNTIYDGESVLDFYLFTLRRQPRLIKYLFVVFKTLIRYKLCLVSEEEFTSLIQKYAQAYLSELKDIDCAVKDFWDKHQHKIKSFYLAQKKEDDVICSASVDFLLAELMKRIGVQNVLATSVDKETGELHHICFRKTKAKLFRFFYPNAEVDCFYTDSENDAEMMKLAKKTYLVRGETIRFKER